MAYEDLINAAGRKIDAAAYHAEQLRQLLDSGEPASESPPVPVQAHFEGVVVSLIAAIDQLAQAINSGWELGLKQSEIVQRAFDVAGEQLPALREWFQDAIGRDLRRIRTRIIHYSYVKSPTSKAARWSVESAGTDYSGSRELSAYAKAAVEYGRRLGALLPVISSALDRAPR
jgi:hypothetical protein